MGDDLFEIQKLFHLTQVVDDLDAADRWYNRLFSPCRYYRGYMQEAARSASLLAIGDAAVVEPVQPIDQPGAPASPLAKFKARFGPKLHSVAWYVDDLERTVEALRSAGVRLVDIAGRAIERPEQVAGLKYVWTHPKDSHGALEFARLNREFTVDPRMQAHWSAAYWREQHPLAITGRLRIAIGVRDLAAAAQFYETVLGAERVESPAHQPDAIAMAVGSDTVIDLRAADHAEVLPHGEGLLGMGFTVGDIDRAARFLADQGIPVQRHGHHTLRVAPAHALGAELAFTQAEGAR